MDNFSIVGKYIGKVKINLSIFYIIIILIKLKN